MTGMGVCCQVWMAIGVVGCRLLCQEARELLFSEVTGVVSRSVHAPLVLLNAGIVWGVASRYCLYCCWYQQLDHARELYPTVSFQPSLLLCCWVARVLALTEPPPKRERGLGTCCCMMYLQRRRHHASSSIVLWGCLWCVSLPASWCCTCCTL
jgi:hypothetical protein